MAQSSCRVDSRRQSRRMEVHERGECDRLRHRRRFAVEQQQNERDRFAAELDVHGRIRRRTVVALAEQQIQRTADR